MRIFLPASLLMRVNAGPENYSHKGTQRTRRKDETIFSVPFAALVRGLLFLRELDPRFLHFAVRKKPNERFIVEIDNLDAVAPRIAKIAPKRRLKFEFIFAGDFLAHLRQLLFVPHHDAEMPHPIGL